MAGLTTSSPANTNSSAIRSGKMDGSEAASEQAFEMLEEGRWDEALRKLNEAIEIDPSDAASLYNRGKLLLKSGDSEKAITDLSQALKIDPDKVVAYRVRAAAYFSFAEYDEAIADLSEIIRLDPSGLEAYLNRGLAYLKVENADAAIRDFNAAMKIDVTSTKPLFNRAYAYTLAGRWAEAINDLERILTVAPNDWNVKNSFGWLLATCPDASLRNGSRAVVLARAACDGTEWKEWKCLGTLAAAFAETGDFVRAVKYQEEAISLNTMPAAQRKEAERRIILYKNQCAYHQDA